MVECGGFGVDLIDETSKKKHFKHRKPRQGNTLKTQTVLIITVKNAGRCVSTWRVSLRWLAKACAMLRDGNQGCLQEDTASSGHGGIVGNFCKFRELLQTPSQPGSHFPCQIVYKRLLCQKPRLKNGQTINDLTFSPGRYCTCWWGLYVA